MTNYLPSWRGWRAVLFAVIAGIVLPGMTTVRTGRATNPQPIQTWFAAVLLLITCTVCIILAWRRGRRSDRVAALFALALIIWLIYDFINVIT